MAVRWTESFDNISVSFFPVKYPGAATDGAVTGRFGNGVQMNPNNTPRNLLTVLTAQGTWIQGVAFKIDRSISTEAGPFMGVLDGVTGQVALGLDSSMRLIVKRNYTNLGAGTLLGTGTTALTPNIWYYIELKVVVSPTVGSVVARLNELTEINLSGINTSQSGSSTADRAQIRNQNGTGGSQPIVYYDDWYVLDGTTGAGTDPCNDFLGDMRVESVLPNGNGNSSQMTGSDGNSVDNYLLVDDPGNPDSDTTYVESLTVGQKDTYTFSDLVTGTGTVKAIQLNPYARKTDAGTRSIASVTRVAAVEQDSAAVPLSTSYAYYPSVREVDPSASDWTIASVNGAEFGVKVAA